MMLDRTNSPRPRCLIAEDQAIISMMMEIDLEEAGYEIVGPFRSCAEGLEWLREATPDLALLDHKLSDGTCVELARELKRRQIPFAVVSGSVDERIRTQPAFVGVPWLAKPVSVTALKRVVEGLYVASSQSFQQANLTQAAPAQV
jgi:DNA-binding response OmpR family regulator